MLRILHVLLTHIKHFIAIHPPTSWFGNLVQTAEVRKEHAIELGEHGQNHVGPRQFASIRADAFHQEDNFAPVPGIVGVAEFVISQTELEHVG